MNSIEWEENKQLLEETIREYCVEENIVFSNETKQLFDTLTASYANAVHDISELSSVNMEIMRTLYASIQQNTTQNAQQIGSSVPPQIQPQIPSHTKKNAPQEIYSREDILDARNKEFNDKFINAQNDFATFSLKKPEAIDFTDKVPDDTISIDKRIEMELHKRNYDEQVLSNQTNTHNQDDVQKWLRGETQNSMDQPVSTNEIQPERRPISIKSDVFSSIPVQDQDKPRNALPITIPTKLSIEEKKVTFGKNTDITNIFTKLKKKQSSDVMSSPSSTSLSTQNNVMKTVTDNDLQTIMNDITFIKTTLDTIKQQNTTLNELFMSFVNKNVSSDEPKDKQNDEQRDEQNDELYHEPDDEQEDAIHDDANNQALSYDL